MTREEYIEFANALENNYTIDFGKLPEFCDMAVSALSGGEYIKKEDALKPYQEESTQIWMDDVYKHLNSLPTYSIPDIEKIRAEIQEKSEDDVLSTGEQVGLITALEIIDKHIGG